jgi:hypothetical protein
MFQCLTIPMGRFWSFFFNETFRISYYELAKHVGQLRINFGTLWKNHVFISATPILGNFMYLLQVSDSLWCTRNKCSTVSLQDSSSHGLGYSSFKDCILVLRRELHGKCGRRHPITSVCLEFHVTWCLWILASLHTFCRLFHATTRYH